VSKLFISFSRPSILDISLQYKRNEDAHQGREKLSKVPVPREHPRGLSLALEHIMQTLVDALHRCKDQKERDEQVRMEEEWIKNEVEEKFKEKRLEDEVSKQVMKEMNQQSKYKEEEIQRIGRAAQKGRGFLSSDQEKQISRAAINALREPRTSQH
jgi:hypothetical protein